MSLRRLKVERIDLWQLHRIDPEVPVEESLAPIKKLQQQGKILHVGLSEVKPHEIDQARKVIEIVSVQNQYNLGDRQHEDVVDTALSTISASSPGSRLLRANSHVPAARWTPRRRSTTRRRHSFRSPGSCIAHPSCCRSREHPR